MAPIEIQPASLTQVVNYRGRKVAIEDDVLDVAKQLQQISPELRLRFMVDDDPPFWQVEQHIPERDGSVTEQLVLTSVELGSAIVDRVRVITSERYSLSEEIERLEAKAKADREYAFDQDVRERAERIAHAIRTDLGVKRNF